jgi:hypothetical protein
LESVWGVRKVPDDPPERLDQEVVFPPRTHRDENKIRSEGAVRTAIANQDLLAEKSFTKIPAVDPEKGK